MMLDKQLVLVHNDDATAAKLDNGTWQVHVVGPGLLRFYRVKIQPVDTQCPVVLGGEQCYHRSGHEGRHMWGRGD